MTRSRQISSHAHMSGFSLIELIMVMTISTLLFTVVYQLLGMALATERRLDGREESPLIQVEALLKQDLLHMRNRPVRDAQGDQMAAFELSSGQFVRFVRGGLPHVSEIAPGGMSRVAYRLVDSQLIRRTWPSLDLDPGNRPTDQVLLRDVAKFELLAMNADLNPFPQWPPTDTAPLDLMPVTIWVRIELANGEILTLLIPGHGHV